MFNTLKSYQSNSIVVLIAIVKEIRISVTSFIIKNDLENNLEYPSLLALSDCLTSWGILYEAYRIERQSFNSECHGSTFGCCAATTDTCQMTVGGYFCLSCGS